MATYDAGASWIGIFIEAVKLCLSPKALVSIRKGESRRESFTREM
jgi:hypothetical protein